MLVRLLIGGTKRRVNKYMQSSVRIIFTATTDLVAHCQVVGVLLDEGVHLGGAEVVLVHRAAPHRLQLNSVIIIIITIIIIIIITWYSTTPVLSPCWGPGSPSLVSGWVSRYRPRNWMTVAILLYYFQTYCEGPYKISK